MRSLKQKPKMQTSSCSAETKWQVSLGSSYRVSGAHRQRPSTQRDIIILCEHMYVDLHFDPVFGNQGSHVITTIFQILRLAFNSRDTGVVGRRVASAIRTQAFPVRVVLRFIVYCTNKATTIGINMFKGVWNYRESSGTLAPKADRISRRCRGRCSSLRASHTATTTCIAPCGQPVQRVDCSIMGRAIIMDDYRWQRDTDALTCTIRIAQSRRHGHGLAIGNRLHRTRV